MSRVRTPSPALLTLCVCASYARVSAASGHTASASGEIVPSSRDCSCLVVGRHPLLQAPPQRSGRHPTFARSRVLVFPAWLRQHHAFAEWITFFDVTADSAVAMYMSVFRTRSARLLRFLQPVSRTPKDHIDQGVAKALWRAIPRTSRAATASTGFMIQPNCGQMLVTSGFLKRRQLALIRHAFALLGAVFCSACIHINKTAGQMYTEFYDGHLSIGSQNEWVQIRRMFITTNSYSTITALFVAECYAAHHERDAGLLESIIDTGMEIHMTIDGLSMLPSMARLSAGHENDFGTRSFLACKPFVPPGQHEIIVEVRSTSNESYVGPLAMTVWEAVETSERR
jgi:hypothetical protein